MLRIKNRKLPEELSRYFFSSNTSLEKEFYSVSAEIRHQSKLNVSSDKRIKLLSLKIKIKDTCRQVK